MLLLNVYVRFLMSLLESYKSNGLLFNSNFLETTSQAGVDAYRGELVLIEGEIADSKGHSKPPVEIMRGVALLASDKLKMVVGAVDRLDLLPIFLDKYKIDFDAEIKILVFVVNIESAMQLEVEGAKITLIPLVQGVPWNELLDELSLDKSDFKGQSAADKVATINDELKSYKPEYPVVTLEQALAATVDIVREGWGAI
jgi:hypothetical protein